MVTVDLQGPVLTKSFFHTKFKTCTVLYLSLQKKIILKTYEIWTSYQQKHNILKQANNLQTLLSKLKCVNSWVKK